MRKNLKIWAVAFFAGVGTAKVCTWVNAAVVHFLVVCGKWEVAAAVKAAPWICFALDAGLAMSVIGMYISACFPLEQQDELTVVSGNQEDARRGA